MADSWIDRDEFRELVGAFSGRKGRRDSVEIGDFDREATNAGGDETDPSISPGEASEGEESSAVGEVPGEDWGVPECTEVAPEDEGDDSEAEAVALEGEGAASQWEETVPAGEAVTSDDESLVPGEEEMAPTDERGDWDDGVAGAEEASPPPTPPSETASPHSEEPSEDEEMPTASDGRTRAEVEGEREDAEAASEGSDPLAESRKEGVSLDMLVADGLPPAGGMEEESGDALDADELEGMEAEVPGEEPVLGRTELSELVANLTVEESASHRSGGDRAPLFLGEAAELLRHRRRSDFEEDAARAVRTLAEARDRAEHSRLIRRHGETSLGEEEGESSVESLPEEGVAPAAGDPPRESDEPTAVIHLAEAEQTIAEIPFEEEGASARDDAPENETTREEERGDAATAPSSETPVTPDPNSEPEPERNFPARMATFARLARARLQAEDVCVFDEDGYPLHREESASHPWTTDPARLLRVIRAPSPLIGDGGEFGPAQVHDGARGWHCFLVARSRARHIVARLRLQRPLESGELASWSERLAEAIHPPND